MEVKINREIRNYTESMFFGLSLRQFIFSVLACAVAVGLYFLLKPYLGTETVSWVCILGAAPFAALGFVKYNGMTAEKFIWAWIKSEFLMPKKLVFHSTNTYYELMKPTIEQKQKEAYKNNDGYEDDISEQFHRELITPFVDPFEQAEEERIEEEKEQLRQLEIAKVRKVLEMLKPVQRERLIKAILLGMSSRKIAKEEGVYYSVVDKSIAAARKNFKKFYENL